MDSLSVIESKKEDTDVVEAADTVQAEEAQAQMVKEVVARHPTREEAYAELGKGWILSVKYHPKYKIVVFDGRLWPVDDLIELACREVTEAPGVFQEMRQKYGEALLQAGLSARRLVRFGDLVASAENAEKILDIEKWRTELASPAWARVVDKRYGKKTTDSLLKDKRFSAKDGWIWSDLKAYSELKDYYSEAGVGRQGEIIHNAEESEAVRLLSDPEKRKRYDELLDNANDIFLKQVKLPSFRMVALGGGDEIGRSGYYVRVGKHFVLLDAGVKQQRGWGDDLYPRLDLLKILPPVEAVFVSHAHADHVKVLPELIEMLPADCPIFTTSETVIQMRNDLQDAVNKGNVDVDIEKLVARLTIVGTGSEGEVNGLKFRFHNAGHIAGSVMTFLEGEHGDTVLYTGDVNFEHTRHQEPAEPVGKPVKTLITEATYGGKTPKEGKRPSREALEDQLVEAVREDTGKGMRILIPAFGKGRTEEVVDILNEAIDERVIPPVDSYIVGLGAKNAEDLGYAEGWKHFTVLGKKETRERTFYDRETGEKRTEIREKKPDVIALNYELKKMLHGNKPVVIVCGSGFLDQGTSGQLLPDTALDEGCSVVITGHTPEGSPGDLIWRAYNGEPVKILDMPLTVRCKVHKVALSGHASEELLLEFMQRQKPGYVLVVHAEKRRVGRFLWKVRELGFQTNNAENLRVMFDYPHAGLRYLPAESEEERQEVACECGKVFLSSASAYAHAGREKHRLLEPYAYYRFSVTGRVMKPGDIKGAFYSLLEDAESKVLGVFLIEATSTLVVKGRLSQKDVQEIEQKLRFAGRSPVSVTLMGVENAFHGSPVANINLLLGGILAQELTSKMIPSIPEWRPGDMPAKTGGYYLPSRRLIVLPIHRMKDEEDAKLILTHESAHYLQHVRNAFLQKFYAGQELPRKLFLEFTEGWAQYFTVSRGNSKKLLTIYHELGAPEHYWRGREMYETIELAFGKKRAWETAFMGDPDSFGQGYFAAISKLHEGERRDLKEMLKLLEKNKVWKRYWLFWKGFTKGLREELHTYTLTNFSTTLRDEFSGWPEDLVREEAFLLTIANFLISRCSEKPDRRRLIGAIKTLFSVRYQQYYETLRNEVLETAAMEKKLAASELARVVATIHID